MGKTPETKVITVKYMPSRERKTVNRNPYEKSNANQFFFTVFSLTTKLSMAKQSFPY